MFRFLTRNQILCENFDNDGIINHSWPNYEIQLIRSTWIIISVNCYSVTYELTYHHFPNPIESVGKSVLSSTFTPYPWLTSLILYWMLEKRWQGALLWSWTEQKNVQTLHPLKIPFFLSLSFWQIIWAFVFDPRPCEWMIYCRFELEWMSHISYASLYMMRKTKMAVYV